MAVCHAVVVVAPSGRPCCRWLLVTATHMHLFARTGGAPTASVTLASVTRLSVSKHWDNVVGVHTDVGPDWVVIDELKDQLLAHLANAARPAPAVREIGCFMVRSAAHLAAPDRAVSFECWPVDGPWRGRSCSPTPPTRGGPAPLSPLPAAKLTVRVLIGRERPCRTTVSDKARLVVDYHFFNASGADSDASLAVSPVRGSVSMQSAYRRPLTPSVKDMLADGADGDAAAIDATWGDDDPASGLSTSSTVSPSKPGFLRRLRSGRTASNVRRGFPSPHPTPTPPHPHRGSTWHEQSMADALAFAVPMRARADVTGYQRQRDHGPRGNDGPAAPGGGSRARRELPRTSRTGAALACRQPACKLTHAD